MTAILIKEEIFLDFLFLLKDIYRLHFIARYFKNLNGLEFKNNLGKYS